MIETRLVEADLSELELSKPRVFFHQRFRFYIDDHRVEMIPSGVQYDLSPLNDRMFTLFCSNPNRALTREEIYTHSMQMEPVSSRVLRSVDVHVSRLNKALGKEDGPIILSKYGWGFFLADPDRPLDYQEVELASPESLKSRVYRHSDYVFLADDGKLVSGNNSVGLTRFEAMFLNVYEEHLNHFVPDEELISQIWEDGNADSRLINVHISLLKNKFEEIGIDGAGKFVRKRMLGYKLVDESKLV